MEIKTFETGPAPKIKIDTVGGGLRVRGREGESVDIQCGPNANLKADAKNGELAVSADVDCLMNVPVGTTVEAGTIGGDAAFRGFSGDASARTVGGSLSFRSVGGASAETVGGGLTARQLSGGLSVDQVGGDAIVDQVEGDVRIRGMGGDIRLSRVGGVVQVASGGDGKLSLNPQGKAKSEVSAGGALNCYIDEGASVKVRAKSGGDLRLAVPVEATDIPGGCEITLGAGEAEVDLSCGGDLILRTGSDPEVVVAADLGDAIAARVGAEIEAHMVDIEEGLTVLGDRLQTFDADKIGRKIRTSIAKAQRKAEKAQRKAARQRRTVAVMRDFDITPSTPGKATEDERLMILRMLEDGKITVEEAETLLSALES